MSVKMKDLLDRFASMQKAAEETLAAEPGALVGVKDMPGSEHDAQVPASAKKPDAEVTQGQPAGATTAEGAVNGGDAKPLNEGKLEVNQPLENPEQKPAITDDALTAKEAGAHLKDLVGGLLADIAAGKAQAQKQAAAAKPAAKPAEKTAQDANGAQAAQPAQTSEPAKTEEKKDGEKTATAKAEAPKIELNEQMLSKLAEAVATYNAGRKAAEDAIKTAAAKPAEKPAEKTAAEKKAEAIKNIKEACIKAAQAAGLDQAAAEAAAAQAMTDAGVSAEDAQAAQAAAAGAEGAAAAGEGAGEGAAAAEGVQLPEDVTEEELAKAIIDCVQSGELDVESAKAIVDEIAGDAGGADAGITEDQAAEAIAAGLESGEITPEQAEGLIAAIKGGAGEAAGAEAQGAEAAAQAAQEASDEAKGAADAEAAIKQAAAAIRANAIQKIASAVNANREAVKQAAAKEPKASPLTMKVASILKAHKEAQDAKAKEGAEKAAAAKSEAQAKYLEGFCKKAAELGVDPQKLAQYIVASKAAQAK